LKQANAIASISPAADTPGADKIGRKRLTLTRNKCKKICGQQGSRPLGDRLGIGGREEKK
jgi:hypothetical protein